ncbi:Uncharacterized protein FWK35_00016573 [Aphis craccivora]|uniref:Uncharacterized protein n=1 Tax=Aphis craccivora TaxID=307492 RepID=A0A6G0ZPU8_APHCR|nr:Uncharacterized protein FWK35_00016573 [Aphis craccivora]
MQSLNGILNEYSIIYTHYNSVCNLGIILTPTLKSNLQIDNFCYIYKALKTLGFIKRVVHDLKLLTPLKAL